MKNVVKENEYIVVYRDTDLNDLLSLRFTSYREALEYYLYKNSSRPMYIGIKCKGTTGEDFTIIQKFCRRALVKETISTKEVYSTEYKEEFINIINEIQEEISGTSLQYNIKLSPLSMYTKYTDKNNLDYAIRVEIYNYPPIDYANYSDDKKRIDWHIYRRVGADSWERKIVHPNVIINYCHNCRLPGGRDHTTNNCKEPITVITSKKLMEVILESKNNINSSYKIYYR